MTRLGIVTGLAAESDCLERAARALPDHARPLIYCAGADPGRALSGAEQLIAQGAEALVSFGIAGGLAPHLRPGVMVLADAVLAPDGRRIATDEAWRTRLEGRARAVCTTVVAPMTGYDSVVRSAADKAALFGATGAVAVDMESHAVAAAAHAATLPLLVVRVVADPAARRIPLAASSAVDVTGRVRIGPVLRRLLATPGDFWPLLRLAADNRRAFAALGRVAALDPVGFALL